MYTEEQIRDKIIDTINLSVEESNGSGTITRYRSPVIGFASARDPLYERASEIIGYDVLAPVDLLSEAETVVSFFIPFDEAPIKYSRSREQISTVREWSLGYYELNLFIGKTMERVVEAVSAMGVKAVTEPVTENYDPVALTTNWPHKTSAYIAGLGTFGINRVVITPQGCAGRLGTVVIDRYITPTERPAQENCLYKREGKCGVCAKRCPTTALRYNSFSRFLCNVHEVVMRENPSALDRGCPMCNGASPCGIYLEPKIEGHHVYIGRDSCEDLRKETS